MDPHSVAYEYAGDTKEQHQLLMYEIDDPISSKGILNCCLCIYNLLFKSCHAAPHIVVTTTLFFAILAQKLYH
jgi:hypothetical protein